MWSLLQEIITKLHNGYITYKVRLFCHGICIVFEGGNWDYVTCECLLLAELITIL